MRIISGTHKGRIITPPRNLRARPTTDFAKENLFNVLAGFGFDYEECDVLDLFAGTGSVSYEFASRGVRSVTAVEINAVHQAFIRRTASELGFGGLFPVKANVFNYLRACTRKFDIIFSDAPYDLRGSEEVISLVFERGLLRASGVEGSEGLRGAVSGGPEGEACEEYGTAPEGSTNGMDSEHGGVSLDDGDERHPGGLLIFEHSKGHNFSNHPHFLQTRSYGSVQFSLFG